jgi:hypothetical protein
MSVWKRIGRELRWFFIALMCSALLAFLFLQLHGMVRSEEPDTTVFSLGRYMASVVIMLVCLYAGRFTVRFIRIIMTGT